MRPVPLTVLKGGINRLRTKGGARADMLYDLVNGYLTDAGTAKSRPGTERVATLPSTTKGLVSFGGSLHTFSNAVVVVPAGYLLHVITHPDDVTLEITKVHFAKPFMGYLYVVAEFEEDDDGDAGIFHYWLREVTWTANTIFTLGDVVVPTTPTGVAYKATRLVAARPLWAASVARTTGDQIEPTVANKYYYTVTTTVGANPHSGTTEPNWPVSEGATINEDANQVAENIVETAPQSTDVQIPQDVQDRYG